MLRMQTNFFLPLTSTKIDGPYNFFEVFASDFLLNMYPRSRYQQFPQFAHTA